MLKMLRLRFFLFYILRFTASLQAKSPVSRLHIATEHSTCLANIPALQFPVLLSLNTKLRSSGINPANPQVLDSSGPAVKTNHKSPVSA